MPRESATKDMLSISFKGDVPKYQLVLKKNHIKIVTPHAFNHIKRGVSGTITGSMMLGLNTDPTGCLGEASRDLRLIGIILDRKTYQMVKTNTNFVFLGAPNTTETEVANT